MAGAHLVENTESHQIIEEFMLAANEAVAELLAKAELHFLRRVHQAPDPRKLKALTEFVAGLGFQVESLESRFELQKLLADVAGQPEERAVNYALLRSLQRAVYSPEEEGHYALASECYCHFTSPIRRYPDLTIHRLLDALMTGKKPRNDFGELAVLGEHCSDRERRAEAAERELTKVKLLDYLSTRIGTTLEAVVTGVEEFGLFVQGIELPAEGLVHVSSLADDFYRFDRALAHAVRPSLGQLAIAWATACAWPWPASTSTAASSIFASSPAARRSPRPSRIGSKKERKAKAGQSQGSRAEQAEAASGASRRQHACGHSRGGRPAPWHAGSLPLQYLCALHPNDFVGWRLPWQLASSRTPIGSAAILKGRESSSCLRWRHGRPR